MEILDNIIFGVISLLLFIAWINLEVKITKFIKVKAKVIYARQDMDWSLESIGDSQDCKYRFVYNGKTYETAEYGSTLFGTLHNGEKVEIYINPNNPNDNIPPIELQYRIIYILGTVCFLAMAILF